MTEKENGSCVIWATVDKMTGDNFEFIKSEVGLEKDSPIVSLAVNNYAKKLREKK